MAATNGSRSVAMFDKTARKNEGKATTMKSGSGETNMLHNKVN